ncbi:MAG: hypothetical protein FWC58_00825 [Desulfobulbus sp.]|nr:hypothetical protein [Desulfobulbus sp.]
MEMLLLLIAIGIVGSIGLAIFLIASLVSIPTAFGNKHRAWGVIMILFSPIAVFYCFTHPEVAAWPRNLFIKSIIALSLALISFLVVSFSQRP